MNRRMQINAQNQTTPITQMPSSPIRMNPPDPFEGWTAVDERLYDEMRPEVPGVTS